VTALWLATAAVASAHVAGIEALVGCHLGDRSDLESVSGERLIERLVAGDVVLDVRDGAEYVPGGLPVEKETA
jgi:hypothetical protein